MVGMGQGNSERQRQYLYACQMNVRAPANSPVTPIELGTGLLDIKCDIQ